MLRRPRHATVVAYLALFVAMGGTAIAASTLGKNTVGPKQLKKNAVTTAKVKKEAITGAKVKKGTLSGTQINVSTLGTVPSSDTAGTANSLAPPENWHLVGAPGEPEFENGWKNSEAPNAAAAFYKDHDGVVHLRGFVNSGTSDVIFLLPPGYRPAAASWVIVPEVCAGGTFCAAGNTGPGAVLGAGVSPGLDGAVQAPPEAVATGIESISFRAEG